LPDVASFEDFTEDSYRRIIRAARERYAFEPYGTTLEKPHVLWRHDIDYSVHRGLRLAEIEAEENVRCTYFLTLHGEFYNLLEKASFERAIAIAEAGHELGLHFDAGFYGGFENEDDLGERITYEAGLLADFLGREIRAFSLHNTQVSGSARFDSDVIGGLINANGRALMSRYTYVSDSNCYWRHRRLPDVIDEGADERIQVLTHPECWQEEPMSPRDRISRCAEGRARFMMQWHDDLLASYGRQNITSEG
jgi:hypothetical protein